MIFLVFHIVRMGKLPLLYYFSSFIIFFSGIKLSLAADSISQEDSIKDGDTLLSSEQSFELGFFSPGNSKNRYLGMWYKKSPETVVWVANRNKPVVGANGVLSITDGNLVLVNGTKDIIWSSNVSTKVENPVAELLECGNFVLREKFSRNTSDSYLWQSFDYPSDVLLPSMNLGRNLKTGLDRYLTSWRSTEDPSSGNFTLRFDIRVLPEVVIYRESMIIARTGPWNGLFFAGIPAQQPTSIFGQVVVHTQDEYSFIYESTSGSADMFVKLNQSGWIEWHVWNERKARWTDNYTMPEDICGSYGRCGANTICSINDKSPNCECLEGFIPNSHNNLTSSGGCVRSSQFDCDAGDVFVKLDGIKLPDLIDVSLNESINFEDCKAGCLKHCSCKAYTISNITRGGSGCLMWFGDLIDTRKLPQNRGTQDIYLRVPASERVTNPTARNKGNRSKELIIVILIILSTIVILGLIITYITRNFRRKGEDLMLFDLGMNLDNDSELTEVKGKGGTKEVKLPLFSFASVSAATDSFSDKNKLGEGGFGSVYKGTLLKGGEIAVKRLSTKSGQGWEEFKNEAVLIAKLQHKNLVRVLGCCIEQNEKILIYEYLPNKSLDIVLFDPMQCKLLDWGTRIRIIEGIAQGLLYLHEYSRLRIIHRDLKASNILLDKDMNPKISDFGMARIFGADELQANTNRIVGTFGYMSPEYVLQGIFSNKSDVFSFGVLLLEIISGKKNSRFCQENSQSLLGYAWDSWLNDRGMDLMDPTLEGAPCNDMLLRYINIALLCAQESAEDRPSMSDVVSMLSNESAPLPTPEKPAFTHVRSSPM